MGDRRKIKTRILTPRTAKEGRNEDSQSLLDQEKKEAGAAYLEPFDWGRGMRNRQSGSTSKRILQEEGEEGQPVMRYEPRKPKSIQPEEDKERESIFWSGYSKAFEKDKEGPRSQSPRLKMKLDTADLHRDENVKFIMLAVRDFVLYALYLASLMILVFGSRDLAYNYYANTVSDHVTKSKFQCTIGELTTVETFMTLNAPQHVWCFLEQVLLPFFHPENDESGWVLMESVLVGAPAMVQVRVKNDTCQTAPLFKDLFKTCYDYYSLEAADRDDFGDRSLPFRWQPNLPEITGSRLPIGSGDARGGFQFNFTTDYNFTKNWLEEIREKLWIRQGTRFLLASFALYAPGTNLFLVVGLQFEFVPAGGVLTDSFFYTWKILRYVRKWDFFVASCEVINIMFVIYFTFEEGTQILLLGSQYLKNWWNVLDVIILLLSYVALTTAVCRHLLINHSLPDKIRTVNTNVHSSFNEFIWVQSLFITNGSLLMFFACIKLFKFGSLFRSTTLILTSVERAVPELTIMFLQALIIAIGFAMLGHSLFGQYVVQFSTITSSFFSMVGIYVGRMHFYRKCLKIHPIIGPLYFGTYIVLVCVLHLNAFVGVVVHGYREAQNVLNEEPQRQYMGDLLFNAVVQLLTRLRSDRVLMKMLMKDIIDRSKVDFDEFVVILKRHNINGLELRLLLARYELKRGDDMSFDKFLEIYNDVRIRHQLQIESDGHNNALELIDKSERLLASCNTAMDNVQTKVDMLLDQLLSESSKEVWKREQKEKKKKKDNIKWF